MYNLSILSSLILDNLSAPTVMFDNLVILVGCTGRACGVHWPYLWGPVFWNILEINIRFDFYGFGREGCQIYNLV